jgi:hypothetical protein
MLAPPNPIVAIQTIFDQNVTFLRARSAAFRQFRGARDGSMQNRANSRELEVTEVGGRGFDFVRRFQRT